MSHIIKPWGSEELIEVNSNYAVKKLTMLATKRCSLQYHTLKTETIFVLSGILIVQIGCTEHILKAGHSITIPNNTIHRMSAPATDHATYLECSTPELDDVVRVEDDYERICICQK